MSNEQQPKEAGERPSHVAYLVTQKGEGQKSEWQKAGVGWAGKDGGMSLRLDGMRKEKSLVIRPAKEKKELSLF